MPLTAENILSAFRALASELEREHERAELVVAGGAALVLLFRARASTKDVDAYFVRPDAAIVRTAAAHVAVTLDLPSDWLNDAAKAYFVGVSADAVLFDSPSLTVRAASIPQLLAMKLAAWRDAIDRNDARLLLEAMSGSRDEIWDAIRPFVPPHDANKASYALDDLWETMRGHS